MLNFIITIAAIFSLVRDYKKDRGFHTRAKTVHAICMISLCLIYGNAYRILGSFISRASEYTNVMLEYPTVAMVSGTMRFSVFLAHLILSLVLLSVSFSMLRRNIIARKIFLIVVPVMVIVETFNLYVGSIPTEFRLSSNGQTFFMFFFICLAAGSALIFAYTRNWMKAFFARDTTDLGEYHTTIVDAGMQQTP